MCFNHNFIIFVFQGYEGSLLKVTNKNGKTASVSTSFAIAIKSKFLNVI